jgi:hypothetical protein
MLKVATEGRPRPPLWLASKAHKMRYITQQSPGPPPPGSTGPALPASILPRDVAGRENLCWLPV